MPSPPIEHEPTHLERSKHAHSKPENVAVETRSVVQSVAETIPFAHLAANLAETNPLSEVSIYERMRSAKPLNPGDFLGQGQAYRITKRIGRGGMGETFLADEMENGEVVWEVVCKIVPPEIQNLEQEILAVRRTFLRVHKLNHTNICPIRGLKFDDTYGWFLIMGYANGGSLTQYLAKHPDFSQGKGIPFTEALKILTPIARALDYIHEEGVFHRDIKPDNVMFTVNKQTRRMTVQVIDFGLSAQLQQSNLQAGTIQANAISGTPHYMAPEQWLGKQQCRQTDQYALGVMTYRLLSRKMPFQAANIQALMSQVLTIPAAEIEGQPAHVNAAILKAISKEPEQRFPRCIDFIRALQTVPTTDPLVAVTGEQDFETSLVTAVEGQNDADTAQQTQRSASMTGGEMTMLPYISRVSEPVIDVVPHADNDTHKVMIQALAAIVIALVVGMIYLLVASSYSTPSVAVAVSAPEPAVAKPESIVPVPEPVVVETESVVPVPEPAVAESVPPVPATVPKSVVAEPESAVPVPEPVVAESVPVVPVPAPEPVVAESIPPVSQTPIAGTATSSSSSDIFDYTRSTNGTTITLLGLKNRTMKGAIEIPATIAGIPVTRVIPSAFWGCTGLTAINVASGNMQYKSVDGVLFSADGMQLYLYPRGRSGTSYIIPNSVTIIGDSAFQSCVGLTSVTIPSSVTSIGHWAFRGCLGLTSVTIPNGVTSIGNSAFWGCSGLTLVTIPSSVTSIGHGAFADCSGLTSINVASGNRWYESVDGVLFGSDGTLLHSYPAGRSEASYIIPSRVVSIEMYAFKAVLYLTSVTIPNRVTSIKSFAFSGCSGLTSVTIPNSVTNIGRGAFSGIAGLTSINVASGNMQYKSVNGVLFSSDGTLLHSYPEGRSGASYIIPSRVVSIEEYAFSGCSGLTSVTIPNSVTSIGHWAFRGCLGLTSVTIPNGVTSIGNSAFSGCTGLTSVTIPASVTSIGNSAFSGCGNLTITGKRGSEAERYAGRQPISSSRIHFVVQ